MIKKDGNQAMLESLVEIVKNTYEDMSVAEQDKYWQKAAILLNCVAKFRKAMKAL